MKRLISSNFFFMLSWILITISYFNKAVAQSHNFALNDYDIEKSKWKSPHADVFSFRGAKEKFDWAELVSDAKDAVGSDKLHAALQACHSTVVRSSEKVKEAEVHMVRLVRHLLSSVIKSDGGDEGGFLIKISDDDVKTLRTFVKDGEFSSTVHASVYDLLKEIIKPPPISYLQKASTVLDWILKPFVALCQPVNIMYIAQFLNFRSTEISDFVNFATAVLPLTSFFFTLWRTRSLKLSLCIAVVVVMCLAYAVEVNYAIKAAEAERMAKLSRRNLIPPECNPESMSTFQTFWSSMKSLFSAEDPCAAYFKDQFTEPVIRPSVTFWKTSISWLPILMESIGEGLGLFTKSFSSHFGSIQVPFMLPIAFCAMFGILGLILASALNGTASVPLLGTFFSKTSTNVRTKNPEGALAARSSPDAQPKLVAGRDIIYYVGPALPPTAGVHYPSTIDSVERSAFSSDANRSNQTAVVTSTSASSNVRLESSSSFNSTAGPLLSNRHDVERLTEAGGGDFLPTHKINRMLSIGAVPHEDLRRRHKRKNSLPINFSF